MACSTLAIANSAISQINRSQSINQAAAATAAAGGSGYIAMAECVLFDRGGAPELLIPSIGQQSVLRLTGRHQHAQITQLYHPSHPLVPERQRQRERRGESKRVGNHTEKRHDGHPDIQSCFVDQPTG
jgi:hypothetical protein